MSALDRYPGLASLLRAVEKPGRYLGGEFGSISREEAALRVVVSYPDLYEIGMSNAAVRILYNRLNATADVGCERVFVPAPDLEAELRRRGLPLFSLETGRPVHEFDVVGFSLGYELTLTNVLTILETGGVSLEAGQRGQGDPIVIAGGPATTNPVPWGPFVDCVFVGEAEGWIERVFGGLARAKRAGAGRGDLLALLQSEPSIWYPGKGGSVRRAFWRGFQAEPAQAAFPVPSVRVVQDHGTVEIMRGCPHACRFCHATALYRPCRQKDASAIRAETDVLVHGAGYRQVTLSSLSSGDYRGVHGLVRELNSLYSPLKVSFSLPSLHVDSLGLELLAEISEVRKSGLTFAVESARPEWQAAVRKLVPLAKVVDIMREAKSRGWRAAKFYFMVGLPSSFTEDESGSIVEFLKSVRAATGMSLNVNVASFIPKPHTPYERAPQLSEQEALDRISGVVKGLRLDGFKVGWHMPFLSLLEGVISRGDERAGMLGLSAYRAGARLDAWEEYFRADLWREAIAQAGWDVIGETCRPRSETESLPWAGVGLALSESEVSDREEVPPEPYAPALMPAGAPAPAPAVRSPGSPPRLREGAENGGGRPDPQRPFPPRLLFSFAKEGTAAYISHLDMMGVFERSLARAGIRARFTEGFNPKPRLEFASPLGLGIESDEEIAAVMVESVSEAEGFAGRLNAALPAGLRVTRCEVVREAAGERRKSLMALQWGSEYLLEGRRFALPLGGTSIRTVVQEQVNSPEAWPRRLRTLARGPGGEPASYFEVLCPPEEVPRERSSVLS